MNKREVMAWQYFLVLAIAILAVTAIQLCLKVGLLGLGEVSFAWKDWPSLLLKMLKSKWIILAISIFVVSFFLYCFLIVKNQLSVVYPILVSGGIVLTAIASWVLFKEQLSGLQMTGIAMIILGILSLLSGFKVK